MHRTRGVQAVAAVSLFVAGGMVAQAQPDCELPAPPPCHLDDNLPTIQPLPSDRRPAAVINLGLISFWTDTGNSANPPEGDLDDDGVANAFEALFDLMDQVYNTGGMRRIVLNRPCSPSDFQMGSFYAMEQWRQDGFLTDVRAWCEEHPEVTVEVYLSLWDGFCDPNGTERPPTSPDSACFYLYHLQPWIDSGIGAIWMDTQGLSQQDRDLLAVWNSDPTLVSPITGQSIRFGGEPVDFDGSGEATGQDEVPYVMSIRYYNNRTCDISPSASGNCPGLCGAPLDVIYDVDTTGWTFAPPPGQPFDTDVAVWLNTSLDVNARDSMGVMCPVEIPQTDITVINRFHDAGYVIWTTWEQTVDLDSRQEAISRLYGQGLIRCRVDFTGDTVVNSRDWFAFVTKVFANGGATTTPLGLPVAYRDGDYNDDGQVNSQDYFDFSNEFFTAGGSPVLTSCSVDVFDRNYGGPWTTP